jgi:hypothetical protein
MMDATSYWQGADAHLQSALGAYLRVTVRLPLDGRSDVVFGELVRACGTERDGVHVGFSRSDVESIDSAVTARPLTE